MHPCILHSIMSSVAKLEITIINKNGIIPGAELFF